MATNQPSTNPPSLVATRFIDWVISLPAPRQPRIWCDECHYWHADINECAYVTKAGA